MFEQTGNNLYFLAWTTTPWTLPSNTALAVGKKIDYLLIETVNQYTGKLIAIVIAKDLISKYFAYNNISGTTQECQGNWCNIADWSDLLQLGIDGNGNCIYAEMDQDTYPFHSCATQFDPCTIPEWRNNDADCIEAGYESVDFGTFFFNGPKSLLMVRPYMLE